MLFKDSSQKQFSIPVEHHLFLNINNKFTGCNHFLQLTILKRGGEAMVIDENFKEKLDQILEEPQDCLLPL